MGLWSLLLAVGFDWFRWWPWFFVLYIAGVVVTAALAFLVLRRVTKGSA
jgi:hypothetical protein